MKRTSKLSALLTLALIVPVLAFAAGRTAKKDISLSQSVQVAGKQLSPGDYQLKWEDSGSGSTQVTFVKEGKTVATVPARIVNEKSANDATAEFSTANGAYKLKRVYVKNQALDFTDTGSGSGSGQ